jgi:hypothetical protein
MTHLWGPALDAEVDYRRAKLTKVAASSSRRRLRKVRRTLVRAPSTPGVTRPRAA